MLPSLPKRLPSSGQFFLRVCLWVVAIHCLVLILASVLFRTPGFHEIYVSSPMMSRHLNLVVMPYARSVSRKTLAKQMKTATRAVARKKQAQRAKPHAPPTPKKPVVAKKVLPKKPAAKHVEKAQPKTTEKPQEQSVKKPVEKIKPAEERPLKQQKKSTAPLETKKAEKKEEAIDPSEPIYVGRNDMAAIKFHDQIASAIHPHWHPPLGIDPARPCTLAVHVGPKGSVLAVNVAQGSGVLAYDMAARMAVMQAEFPQAAFNQNLTVHL